MVEVSTPQHLPTRSAINSGTRRGRRLRSSRRRSHPVPCGPTGSGVPRLGSGHWPGSEVTVNNSNPDANVIPLGVRGRPGRGGRETPSAAARSLSGKPQRRHDDPPRVAPSAAVNDQAFNGRSADERATSYRSSPGVPIPDIVAALTGAAQQVFGDNWERRAAELMAFMRRRLTGDYEVDEF